VPAEEPRLAVAPARKEPSPRRTTESGCGAPSGTPVMIATPISTARGCVAGCPVTRSLAVRISQSLIRLGPHSVQRPSDRSRCVGEERCVRGRRHPAGAAGCVAGRDPAPADRDAVAQHGGDRHRGDASGQSDRRRCAARRLRQDHSGVAYGRRIGRPACCRGAWRADADRHVSRHTLGLRHRRLAAVGGGPGRHPSPRNSSPARNRP
jgi:hypothetical protein